MIPKTAPILVTGATGQQGAAVIHHLRRGGWNVRAFVRDPNAPSSAALAESGVELVVGDLDDRASLEHAAQGTYGIFAVTPIESSPAREIAWGENIIAAAHSAHSRHVVFSSVLGSIRDSGVPDWDTKRVIEERLEHSGLPVTILRPVRFMENHATTSPMGGIVDETLVFLFAADDPVQLVAVDDIGAFAALAFADPERYLGATIELAGDEVTSHEAVTQISEAVGHTITYRQWQPGDPIGVDPASEQVLQQAGERLSAAGRAGDLWSADIPALRRTYPGLTDFATWLRLGGAQRIKQIL
ncbi:NmrA/HSCARG family protein [Natronoglycomyces albus]|uniref:NmrA/HSCARG family protein n=1 Tax=Natronoglycomyces albus TaxID=2811108 RepID=A0A895XPK7_9ACTN|nr:NmrA/HSCARG family protein [Natronoglycomyces albus]QSB05025.1 NmrA/HSCARG family protein [Natronoglycomyces albus]